MNKNYTIQESMTMLIPLLLAGTRLQQLLKPCDPIEPGLEVGRVLERRAGGRGGQVYYLYIRAPLARVRR